MISAIALPQANELSVEIVGTLFARARHFLLVAFLPTLALVLVVLVSAFSTRWFTSEASLPELTRHTDDASVPAVGFLMVLVGAIGFTIRPLTHHLTQLLEGYWGARALSSRLMAWRIQGHLDQYIHLTRLVRGYPRLNEDAAVKERLHDPILTREKLGPHLRGLGAYSGRAARYPDDPRRILPTRLGNALRGAEDRAGRPYNLDAISVTPRLIACGSRQTQEHIDSARTQLDASVTLTYVWLLASFVLLVAFRNSGIWLVWPLVAFVLAYLSYLGAVGAAQEYGVSLELAMDVDRFAMYERLRYPIPNTMDEERDFNRRVTKLVLSKRARANLKYRTSQDSAD